MCPHLHVLEHQCRSGRGTVTIDGAARALSEHRTVTLSRFGAHVRGIDGVARIEVRPWCWLVGAPGDALVRILLDDGRRRTFHCSAWAGVDGEVTFAHRQVAGLGPDGECPVCLDEDLDTVSPVRAFARCGHGVCDRCAGSIGAACPTCRMVRAVARN